MPTMIVTPVTLEGPRLRLEPLSEAHHGAFCAVGLEEDLWRWIPTPVRTPDEMAAYIAFALAEQARGEGLPFAVVERSSGRVIGSTRYGAIEPRHHRVEIGWTWLARPGTARRRTPRPNICCFATPSRRWGAFASSSRPTRSMRARGPPSSASAPGRREPFAST
jgi:Acetyltransferase (GNAT) domain